MSDFLSKVRRQFQQMDWNLKDEPELRLMNGDCREVLKTLPANSVNCCVTSPPYWNLRDYGHKEQLGQEKTPQKYVENLVARMSGVRRVLQKDGTLWLNIGDSYSGSGCGGGSISEDAGHHAKVHGMSDNRKSKDQTPPPGCKPKDMVGIPWMVALALREDGWYLRSDIIWHKPNPMPESVTDRPTRSHEYIFLLSKSQNYYYNADAIAEKCANGDPTSPRGSNGTSTPNSGRRDKQGLGSRTYSGFNHRWDESEKLETRNKRDVWTVPPAQYREAHFATFPTELIRPCILAGCPRGGVVIDPFGGSGTTAQVCKEEGMSAVIIELNEEYNPLIKKRWESAGASPNYQP